MAVLCQSAERGEDNNSDKTAIIMKVPLPSLDELPANKANCATCTHKGGNCLRNKTIKNRQHNGLLYNEAGECTGMIAGCINYTGPYMKDCHRNWQGNVKSSKTS